MIMCKPGDRKAKSLQKQGEVERPPEAKQERGQGVTIVERLDTVQESAGEHRQRDPVDLGSQISLGLEQRSQRNSRT